MTYVDDDTGRETSKPPIGKRLPGSEKRGVASNGSIPTYQNEGDNNEMVEVARGDGSGDFSIQDDTGTLPADVEETAVLPADLSDDGVPDLLVAGTLNYGEPTSEDPDGQLEGMVPVRQYEASGVSREPVPLAAARSPRKPLPTLPPPCEPGAGFVAALNVQCVLP